MNFAVWSCMDCGYEFEAQWPDGGAFMMAMSCLRCGKSAIASESRSFEDGCLMIDIECQLPLPKGRGLLDYPESGTRSNRHID